PVTLPALSTGLLTGGVAITDMTRDGAADIIVLGSSGVTVLFGNGDGTFQPAVVTTIQSGLQSNTTTLADMNQDGILDLVTTNSSGLIVSVYLGTSDGSFLGPVTRAGSFPATLAFTTGDFTGDGKTDAAAVYWVGVA